MKILNVTLDNKESDIILTQRNRLLEGLPDSNVLIVTDSNVRPLFDAGDYPLLELPPGEPAKNFSSIEAILSKAVELGLDRSAIFVGIGGGVICDMTAFAASIYLRGCRVRLAPTTLLSMVDASVGGKTGIDFCGYKNQVGTFYPAETVLIDPSFITTLSGAEYLSGLGEVIKTALLRDAQMLSILEERSAEVLSRDLALMQDLIIRCIRTKGYFVENDFREGGIRAHLNLGHTFGHALEAVEELGGITHGEAVVWGMVKAAELAKEHYGLDEAYLIRLQKMTELYGYRTDFPGHDADEMIEAIRHDKKKAGNELRFIIQKAVGETEIVAFDEPVIRKVLSLSE